MSWEGGYTTSEQNTDTEIETERGPDANGARLLSAGRAVRISSKIDESAHAYCPTESVPQHYMPIIDKPAALEDFKPLEPSPAPSVYHTHHG